MRLQVVCVSQIYSTFKTISPLYFSLSGVERAEGTVKICQKINQLPLFAAVWWLAPHGGPPHPPPSTVYFAINNAHFAKFKIIPRRIAWSATSPTFLTCEMIAGWALPLCISIYLTISRTECEVRTKGLLLWLVFVKHDYRSFNLALCTILRIYMLANIRIWQELALLMLTINS